MPELPFSKEDMAEIRRLAGTPAGKQLISYLQKHQGPALKAAVQQAGAGNYDQAKQLARALLSSPEARELLKQLGR